MRHRRMPIEVEAPEQLGCLRFRINLAAWHFLPGDGWPTIEQLADGLGSLAAAARDVAG